MRCGVIFRLLVARNLPLGVVTQFRSHCRGLTKRLQHSLAGVGAGTSGFLLSSLELRPVIFIHVPTDRLEFPLRNYTMTRPSLAGSFFSFITFYSMSLSGISRVMRGFSFLDGCTDSKPCYSAPEGHILGLPNIGGQTWTSLK